MDLRLNEDQSMMKKVAADFVKSEAPSYVITEWFQKKIAFIPELYEKIAEVGWLGMMLPEEYGGGGASCTDCAAVFEELGRAPLPGPYFSSGVLAAEIILAGGSPAQKKTLLREICNGRAIVIPALSDDPIQWGPRSAQTRLTKTVSGFVLNGAKRFVYDGDAATSFICAARTETGGVVLA
jgi:alkylation response protein AidB-like acyl-CoA dehydrogenase